MLKKIPYGHQSISNKDISAVSDVLQTDWITQGPTVARFEKKLASYVNSKYAVAVSSGTAALHLACLAAGIGPGDEVIVPTLSFVASVNCVLYCGAKPVLVDVYEDTLTINVEETKKKITKKTKAIIAVDFAGHPADWDKLKRLSKKYNLTLIDDAAHALGSKYRDKMIGSIGELTTFSFHPVKTITTGEGGAITTDKKEFYEKLIRLRHHGIYKSDSLGKKYGSWFYDIKDLGYNFRLTDIQAALGISQLAKIDKFIKRRREMWQRYNKAFDKTRKLILPMEKGNYSCAWHIYPIRIISNKITRKEFFDKLTTAGIGVQVHYTPIHLFNFYKRKFNYQKGSFPVAEKYYKSTLTLPLFPDLKPQDQDHIIRKVKEALI